MSGSWDMYPDSAVEYLLREGPPDVHESHTPAEPRAISGIECVYCQVCGYLLWSENGPSKGRKAYEPCERVEIKMRTP